MQTSRAGLAGTFLVAVAAAACSSPLTAPDTVSTAAVGGLVAPSRAVPAARPADTFDLMGGVFVLTFADGDQIEGFYGGQAAVSPPSRSTARLNLTVTSGTGAFDGATGTIDGDGIGVFVGEGNFSLSLDGLVVTAGRPDPVRVRAKIHGTSMIGCAQTGILARLDGAGSAGRFGDIHGVFQHVVGNSGCQ